MYVKKQCPKKEKNVKIKQNLITGTRYLNTEGMLPFENKVAGYIDNNGLYTKNHESN